MAKSLTLSHGIYLSIFSFCPCHPTHIKLLSYPQSYSTVHVKWKQEGLEITVDNWNRWFYWKKFYWKKIIQYFVSPKLKFLYKKFSGAKEMLEAVQFFLKRQPISYFLDLSFNFVILSRHR